MNFLFSDRFYFITSRDVSAICTKDFFLFWILLYICNSAAICIFEQEGLFQYKCYIYIYIIYILVCCFCKNELRRNISIYVWYTWNREVIDVE